MNKKNERIKSQFIKSSQIDEQISPIIYIQRADNKNQIFIKLKSEEIFDDDPVNFESKK